MTDDKIDLNGLICFMEYIKQLKETSMSNKPYIYHENNQLKISENNQPIEKEKIVISPNDLNTISEHYELGKNNQDSDMIYSAMGTLLEKLIKFEDELKKP